MSNWTGEHDRRKTFRINEQAKIEFRLIKALSAEPEVSDEHLFPDSQRFNLNSQIRLMDFELESMINRNPDIDQPLLDVLNLLNRKLNLIAGLTYPATTDPSWQLITLSEEGCSFQHSEAIKPDQRLAIRITLESDGLGLEAQASCRYSNAEPNGRFRIGVQFQNLNESQQQLLGRHILEYQARQRRLAKETELPEQH